jgi:opacity protein-like surface antigen
MKKKLLLSSLLTLLPLSAIAGEPSFNYVEGGYTQYSSSKNEKVQSNLSDDSDYKNGFKLNGRFEIDPSFFAVTDFEYLQRKDKYLEGFEETKTKNYGLGLGYKMMLDGKTVLFTHIDYIQSNEKIIDKGSKKSLIEKTTMKGSGYKVGLGIKALLTNVIEVSSEFSYLNYGKIKQKIGTVYSKTGKRTFKQINIALNYKIMDPISLYLRAEHQFGFSNDKNKGFNSTNYTLGVRYSF